MSLPSTPARSSRASTASTISSRCSKSPIELTPRSKVKALLAKFDEDSDDEPPTKKPSKPAQNISKSAIEAAPKERSPARSVSCSSAPARTATVSPAFVQNRFQSRTQTPGLFVSPTKPASQQAAASGSDSDLPANPTKNARFMELVARKRTERQAKAKAEQEEHERKLQARLSARLPDTAETNSDDEETGAKLTQQARPTRRAGKKALEEMNRETQRIQRNMQLAHQAKTKKRITTKDLFAKLNYNQPQVSSATASSDVEASQAKDTPPTSPAIGADGGLTAKETGNGSVFEQGSDAGFVNTVQTGEDDDDDLPSLLDIIGQKMKQDRGKAPMRDVEIQEAETALDLGTNLMEKAPSTKKSTSLMLGRNILLQKPQQPEEIDLSSDDDDHKRAKPQKTGRLPVFDRLPAKKASEPHSMLTLRALAHLTSPSKTRKSHASITLSELQLQLQKRARQQAQRAREERIAELKAKGIIVQTEEERERDQLELDNLLEKARKEALELAKKERAANKKDGGRANGNQLPDSRDESDDEDFIASDEEEEEGGVELSGSEDESEIQEDEETAGATEGQGLFDDEAEDDAEEEEETGPEESDVEMNDAVSELDSLVKPNKGIQQIRNKRVIMDEEDEETEASASPSVQPPVSAPKDAMAAFGFEAAPTSSMGLTQMFAGTMLDTQSQSQPGSGANPSVDIDTQQDSLDFLRGLSSVPLPPFDATMAELSQDFLIQDSQTSPSQNERTRSQPQSAMQQISLGISQLPSQLPRQTQLSEVPDPTQDAGFQARTPAKRSVPPPSTVETEILPIPESPVVKRGRLRRRNEEVAVLSDLDEDEADVVSASGDEENDVSANAFDVMRKAAKRPTNVEAFDKKKSMAKEMVQEQAEESEDEYAGLGGASDDESTGELDEETAKMIDTQDVEVDETQIAAFFADKERKDDEKRIDKLYKDIMNGALRRKRGADIDLSDDEDDRAAERRRRKQREFAKMRKALLADENIGKIAENPKKAAFLAAIEDHEDMDIEFLGSPEKPTEPLPSEEGDRSPIRRRRESPPRQRAAQSSRIASRPPSRSPSLARSPSPAADPESDSELYAPPSPPPSKRPSFINRLSFPAAASTLTTSNTANLAFHAPSTTTFRPGFRIPSLLRQATSNQSLTSATSSTSASGRSTPTAETVVRRGGSGKSSIHYQAREAERRALLEMGEKKRKGELEKMARRARAGRSVLAVLENGRGFE